jgi:hypothetical protein
MGGGEWRMSTTGRSIGGRVRRIAIEDSDERRVGGEVYVRVG